MLIVVLVVAVLGVLVVQVLRIGAVDDRILGSCTANLPIEAGEDF